MFCSFAVSFNHNNWETSSFLSYKLFFSDYYYCFFNCHCFCFSETGQVDSVLIERYNTPGFVGCLSRVQFNRIAPLKAALRPSAPSTASIQGVLVESNCGALPLTIPTMPVTFNPWHSDSGETFRVMRMVIIHAVLYENSL